MLNGFYWRQHLIWACFNIQQNVLMSMVATYYNRQHSITNKSIYEWWAEALFNHLTGDGEAFRIGMILARSYRFCHSQGHRFCEFLCILMTFHIKDDALPLALRSIFDIFFFYFHAKETYTVLDLTYMRLWRLNLFTCLVLERDTVMV